MLNLADIETYRENNRIEAKRATGGLPESVWETYSSFANTVGGILLLGVEELPGHILSVCGLPDPERLAAELLSIVSDPARVSANILGKGGVAIREADGRRILTVHVPRAPQQLRPVYLGNDPFTGAYIRSGEGDYRMPAHMVARMLAGRTASAPAATDALSQAEKTLLHYLTEHSGCTVSEAATRLGVSPGRAAEILSLLVRRGYAVCPENEADPVFRLRG